MSTVLIWSSALGTIAGILFRPRKWPEAVWAGSGAGLLILCRLLSPATACRAIGKGTDVYLFLAGIMLLAELARRDGLFDWLASHDLRAARRSRTRLFALVYAVEILVTRYLSNDAAAVVLTPTVYAAVKKARTEALPYLLSCRFHRQRSQLRIAHLESYEPGSRWEADPPTHSLDKGVPLSGPWHRRSRFHFGVNAGIRSWTTHLCGGCSGCSVRQIAKRPWPSPVLGAGPLYHPTTTRVAG